jgi:hypothetical protein
MNEANPFKGAKIVYMCCLCTQEIERTDIDPCALIVVANWAGAEDEQRSQQLWCHGKCIEQAVDGAVGDDFFVTRVDQ